MLRWAYVLIHVFGACVCVCVWVNLCNTHKHKFFPHVGWIWHLDPQHWYASSLSYTAAISAFQLRHISLCHTLYLIWLYIGWAQGLPITNMWTNVCMHKHCLVFHFLLLFVVSRSCCFLAMHSINIRFVHFTYFFGFVFRFVLLSETCSYMPSDGSLLVIN